jgi:hypothetical protein
MIGYTTVGNERGKCYSENAVPNTCPYNAFHNKSVPVHEWHLL